MTFLFRNFILFLKKGESYEKGERMSEQKNQTSNPIKQQSTLKNINKHTK
jgi:hypothetical protein